MRHITTIIIGAGQAGLAMSQQLSKLSIDHVILERGQVAHSWSTERWDSLRLLTPNWQSRLPGFTYQGSDPDGFRTMSETVDFLAGYAAHIHAPVQTETEVTLVQQTETGYYVSTNQGEWSCRTLVIASGACNIAKVPAAIKELPPHVRTLSPIQYRNPDMLEDGGVLIVGASASGVQLAQEIQRSGRQVTLATGEHVRVPRTYRGRDIKWWMDATGILDMDLHEVDDIKRARRVPSLQLIGSLNRETISLNSLQAEGVTVVGRLMSLANGKAQFSGSLANVCSLADLKMNRLLTGIDEWVDENGMTQEVEAVHRFEPTAFASAPMLDLNLIDANIKTVVWATGYRSVYCWLDVPVVDRHGMLRHDGGVVDAPGLYAMGQPFQRRRKSTLIDGAGDDARDVSAHIAAYLAGNTAVAA